MTTYTISRKDCTGETLGTIEADTYQEAANKAARRFFSGATGAHRVTGEPRLSGVFRATRPASGGGTSLDEQFHVM